MQGKAKLVLRFSRRLDEGGDGTIKLEFCPYYVELSPSLFINIDSKKSSLCNFASTMQFGSEASFQCLAVTADLIIIQFRLRIDSIMIKLILIIRCKLHLNLEYRNFGDTRLNQLHQVYGQAAWPFSLI